MGKEKGVRLGENLMVNPLKGTISYLYQDRMVVEGATAEVAYKAEGRKRKLGFGREVAYGVVEDRVSLSVRNENLELTWELQAKEGVTLRLMAHNLGQRPLEILTFTPFLLSQSGLDLGSGEDWSFFQNGWQSWSPAFAREVGDGHYVEPGTEGYRLQHEPYPTPAGRKSLVSHQVTVLHDRPSGASFLLGFVTAKDQMGEVHLEMDDPGWRRLACLSHADGVVLAPGEKMESEELLLRFGYSPLSLLEGYASTLGQRMGARVTEEVPTGWCSWYYFFGENGADEVLANVEKARKEGLSLGHFVIDDGYQEAVGDWLTSIEEKFPQGMERLREEIEARGGVAGLWTAPFAVSSRSRLYQEHPDWVLRDAKGEPLLAWRHRGVEIYALDLTHPEVQGWLKELFSTLSQKWGYRFFKIDFLYAGALEGQRHDPQATRAQAFRRGLQAIREAVGEGYLLGCGAPLGPAVGLVDGMRIGPDVAIHWPPLWSDLSSPSVRNALRNVLARYFTHRRLWCNDPDCILVRPRGEASNLKLNEVQTLASLAALSGGAIFSGDDLASLAGERLRYLKRILPPYGQAATPLDLFQRELPRLFALPVKTAYGEWLVAAIINWEERTVTTTLDLAQFGLERDEVYHVYDFWGGRYLGLVRETITLPRHQPHQTAVLLFKRPSPEPQFLTSTYHITQGAVEVASVEREARGRGQGLLVRLVKPGQQFGEILFALSEGYRAIGALVDGRRHRWRAVAPRVVALGFTLEDKGEVELWVEPA